ncbi:Ig-like domain-containing protein, partial [Vibrio fluvialis]|nr:Ig-like domain-containing protein [Vibrio fluvialis]
MVNVLKWVFLLIMLPLLFQLTGCNSEGAFSDSKGELEGSRLVSLQIRPATTIVPIGFSRQYIAEALFNDGQVVDITEDSNLSWHSSDSAIATVDSRGLAKGISGGIVTITASGMADGQHFSASASLTVSSAVVTHLQVTPAVAEVPVGLEQQYTATAFLSDGTSMDVTNDAAI